MKVSGVEHNIFHGYDAKMTLGLEKKKWICQLLLKIWNIQIRGKDPANFSSSGGKSVCYVRR